MTDKAEYRFDGRVALVTGAGRGIGRGYAKLLAERGARVIVNDLGGATDGEGADSGPAQRVVDEIRAMGGTAIADTNDVSTQEGAEAIIAGAIAAFGRIDVIVNNAGIIQYASFPDFPTENLDRHLAVHLYGPFHLTKAAWPHFVAQGYGRIVLTTSVGQFGMSHNLSYAVAKSAMIGFANSTRIQGEPHNIKINTIAPNATTRMAGVDDSADEPTVPTSGESYLPTHLVSPLVAYLCHEDLEDSGGVYVAGGSRFARLFLAATPGYLHPDHTATVEDVAQHWGEVNEEAGYYVPTSLTDWSARFFEHQKREPVRDEDFANLS